MILLYRASDKEAVTQRQWIKKKKYAVQDVSHGPMIQPGGEKHARRQRSQVRRRACSVAALVPITTHKGLKFPAISLWKSPNWNLHLYKK